jgi:SAM-dependent methyltransferase
VALLDSDETPIPAIEDRENYYGERHIEYWLSGYADWVKVKQYLDRVAGPKSYRDMGGSTGRVIRHAARDPNVSCWLSDINVNWIDWVDRWFTYPVQAYQSRIFPIIPAEDNTFSVISAFSVFTHLDCDEIQWLLELRRVLRPGGYLYVTSVRAALPQPRHGVRPQRRFGSAGARRPTGLGQASGQRGAAVPVPHRAGFRTQGRAAEWTACLGENCRCDGAASLRWRPQCRHACYRDPLPFKRTRRCFPCLTVCYTSARLIMAASTASLRG